jgi:hypothetical protein
MWRTAGQRYAGPAPYPAASASAAAPRTPLAQPSGPPRQYRESGLPDFFVAHVLAVLGNLGLDRLILTPFLHFGQSFELPAIRLR